MRRLVALVALVCIVAPAARSNPVTQDPCPGSVEGPVVWKQVGGDVLENLLFAEGSLWVSDGSRSSVLRLGPDGTEGAGLTGIPSPGGLQQGPDGLIYAGWGNGAANALSRNRMSKVIRFAPGDPAGTLQDYATGFSMANGMTFGPGDDLYISNDFDRALIRIPRADPAAWAPLADVYGTNGLVVDPAGQYLYAAITFDQRSPIERISLAPGAEHRTIAQLSLGVLSLEPRVHPDPNAAAPLLGVKGLDDMTRDADARRNRDLLYVVANGMGELLRVDPTAADPSASACMVASGLRNPSSVRIAPEDGPFADGKPETIDLYVTEFSGAIRLVRFTPA